LFRVEGVLEKVAQSCCAVADGRRHYAICEILSYLLGSLSE
jgi:hypothetical protein